MSCLSKSFYPAVAPNKSAWLLVRECGVYVYLDCVFPALPIYSRPQPAAWKMDFNIRINGTSFMSTQPWDFLPDKGRGRAAQSPSSCSEDTCGPTHCLGAGHSEQSHGRRSFHCTSYPGSLRSSRNTDHQNHENRRWINYREKIINKSSPLKCLRYEAPLFFKIFQKHISESHWVTCFFLMKNGTVVFLY